MAEIEQIANDAKPTFREEKPAEDKKDVLTVDKAKKDFQTAYRSKSKLIAREKEDFLFALGDQWKTEDVEKLKKVNVTPITDNRIAPNIFLLTGLERQNRTDFKAFPEGEEDGLKAEVASTLFKNAIKVSDFSYKSSDQFKDGITCGESHLELYLDYTEDLLNGKPMWRKLDGNVVYPEPGFTEYDFSDARYVYKIVQDISKEDLINLFPNKKEAIERAGSSRMDFAAIAGGEEVHVQKRDYADAQSGKDGRGEDSLSAGFDLIERYYKNWVEAIYIADKQNGKIEQAETEEKASQFIDGYKLQIEKDAELYQQAIGQVVQNHVMQLSQVDPAAAALPVESHLQMLNQQGALPPPPPEQNPDRFMMIKRLIPEIWCFAYVPTIEEPLANEKAWFYPKWKTYPFVPYFARFSSAPLKGDQAHLLIQGLVHGVKGVQEKHNKAEMLILRHLNSTANSGWLSEEDAWVDKDAVKNFGASPGINLEYKRGFMKPERINPVSLSVGHAEISATSAEAIKAQLGINADLLASQQGGADSGRAIALRQRQGLLMVQELFDNLSRSRIIAGRFLLSQIGRIYDTDTAMKVLGEAFLVKNFPPPMELVADPKKGQPMVDPRTGQPGQRPIQGPDGQPMKYDTQMAEVLMAEVLSGDLGKYDVSVGEAVASETQRLANSAEIKEIAGTYPGLIPPDILVSESQLPASTKNKILSAMQQQQAMAQMAARVPQGKPKPEAA